MNKIKINRRKGFTLIELIVVMAILAVLVLLAAPKFLGQTKEAQFTKHISNAKVLEDASERYYIDHGQWPRGEEEPYTPEEVAAYADKIYDITGKERTLEEGKYWDIDYEALAAYAKLPDEDERANYVLRNPVGKVYYLEGISKERQESQTGTKPDVPTEEGTNPGQPETPKDPEEWVMPDYYEVAADEDFSGTANGSFRYIGTKEYVVIPDVIKGVAVTSYANMFNGTGVKGVASSNPNVTNMTYMFRSSRAPALDLRGLKHTGNVTNMSQMFRDSQATTLDLSSFNTANVTNMRSMFEGSQATTLDLSGFDTSQVTDMRQMFNGSQATTLDLSSFDMRSVTTATDMFYNAKITGPHVARSGYDAYQLNGLTGSAVTFLVKDHPATYVLATDVDFHGTTNGTFKYRGTAHYVIIPDKIKGVAVTSYKAMFDGTDVKGVKSTNPNVTDMSYMFQYHQGATVDLTGLDTTKTTNMSYMFYFAKTTNPVGLDASNVTNMSNMFRSSRAPALDLSSFNTAKVTDMSYMFYNSQATSLDLSSFNTANVTDMGSMFRDSQAPTLDLSSFDMRSVTRATDMFYNAKITGPHVARSEYDATRLNALTGSSVTFAVKQ